MALDIRLEKKSRPFPTTMPVITASSNALGSGLFRELTVAPVVLSYMFNAFLILCRPSKVPFSNLMADSVMCLNIQQMLHLRTADCVIGRDFIASWSSALPHTPWMTRLYRQPRGTSYSVHDQGCGQAYKRLEGAFRARGLNESLIMFYYVNSIYLHQMVMYTDHNAEDCQPPFVVKRAMYNGAGGRLTPAYIDAISTVQSSTQALLDTYFQLNVDNLQALPIVKMFA